MRGRLPGIALTRSSTRTTVPSISISLSLVHTYRRLCHDDVLGPDERTSVLL